MRAVGERRLGGPGGLPGVDGLAEDRVDRFGERGAGLVGGHVAQTDGITGQDIGGVAGDRSAVVLPADAADAQPGDLVAALAGEQPGQGDRADQLERVVRAGLRGRQVAGGQVEPGPEQLRPDVVGDHPRVRAAQGGDAARDGQGALRVEAAGHPFPFLAVAEEPAQRVDLPGLGSRGQRLAEPVLETGGALDIVTDPHAVQRGDPCCAGLPRPRRRVGGLGTLRGQPSANLEQDRADTAADPRGERGCVMPPVGGLLPGLGAAGGPHVLAGAAGRGRTVSEFGDSFLHRVDGVEPGAVEQSLLADPVEQVGGHVLQVRAVVGQHQLRDGQRQQRVFGAAELVAPAAQHPAELAEFTVDAVAAEEPPAQHQPLETAEPVKRGEPAQQERVRRQIGPDLVTDPRRRGGPELGHGAAQHGLPIVGRPVPVAAGIRLRATRQQKRDHVQHGAAPVRGRRGVQPGVDRVQRPHQPGDDRPARRGRITGLEPPQGGQPEPADGGGFLGPHDDPQPRAGHRRRPPARFRRLALRHLRAHRLAPAPAVPASVSTRQAWMCCIPVASLSARSRPDRWMYCSVESVCR